MKADLMGRTNSRRSRSNIARRLGSMNRGGINTNRLSPVRRRLSLGRTGNRLGGTNNRRSRSRSRSRFGTRGVVSNKNMPIKNRLGVKPNTLSSRKMSNFPRSASRGRRRGNLNGVAQGRIQKSRTPNLPLRRFRGSSRAPIANNRVGRARGRSVSRVNQIQGR